MKGPSTAIARAPRDEAPELSQKSFGELARFITSELGIKMPESKLTMVESRLLSRVRELGMQSVNQYAEYFIAAPNGNERERFVDAITTNKTDFFREPAHFHYLRETVLPELAGLGAGFKAWSAGCSSGEEPYTLAMVLAEYARTQRGFDFAILATDVSSKVLRRARTAIYRQALIAPVPAEYRGRYLLSSRSGEERLVRIVPALRSKVSFHHLNFMDEEYGIRERFDAIFFRNVMIYFDKQTQEAVINKLCRNLVPGGYLFVGHSESLAGMRIPVSPVGTSIYRKVE
jgi:chemotaxis protein methyltransferase CheR